MPIVSMNDYLTLDEASARSGISRATLRNWIKRGRLPSSHKTLSDRDWSGEKWFVLDRELEQLIGRRLAPNRFAIEQELEGAEERILDAVGSLTGVADPAIISNLRFTAAALADLRAQIGLQQKP